MPGERNGQGLRGAAGALALIGLAFGLAACGSTATSSLMSGSPLDMFGSSSKATRADTAGDAAAAQTDVECPPIQVRTGAATLMIGTKPGDGEPAALDVRYQGTILRTARECQVSAGMMTMKVGIEGRVITGPAGTPGALDVPLRIAVVQEGVNPKPIVSKFARVPVTIANAIDRVTFAHIESDIVFPLPQPLGLIDAYVVYVGFDPLGAQQERKRPPARTKPAARPKQG